MAELPWEVGSAICGPEPPTNSRQSNKSLAASDAEMEIKIPQLYHISSTISHVGLVISILNDTVDCSHCHGVPWDTADPGT